MLKLWLSKNRRTNTDKLMDAICLQAEAGVGGQLLLVPEQFSHMTERALCLRGGDTISRYAEVLGFSRLAARVFTTEGGCAESETDAVGQLLMMSLAVEQVRSRLKIYGSSAAKPEFLLRLQKTFEEFKSYCVSGQQLHSASAALSGSFAQKMEELALLMESYDAVAAQLGQNPETRLMRLCRKLEGSQFPKNHSFYIDGFTDFNGIEQEVLTQLLNGGAEITVALQCDGLEGKGQQFSAARKTAKALVRMAQLQHQDYEIMTLEPEVNDQPLSFLRKKLFSGGDDTYSERQEQIVSISAPDAISQCRIAVGEILRLASIGVRWRDIAVVCADYSTYRPLLESIMNRAEVPGYFAGDTGILRQSVIRMLLTAIEAAIGGMETAAVLAYLKSPFSGLTHEQSDRVENYAFLWNISGKRWEQPWTMSPYGLQRAQTDAAERLAILEADRLAGVAPLVHLKKGLREAKNTGEMVLAVSAFLEEIHLAETLNELAQKQYMDGKLQAAQEYVQIDRLLCGLLEQIYGVLGQSVRSVDNFCRMLKVALSQCSVGTIPASLDCVQIGSPSSQRRCDTDYVFLLGANEGYFPSATTGTGLLSDSERSSLLALGVSLAPSAAMALDRELACIDSVLCAPQKRLYIGACQGQEAYYIRRAYRLFPKMLRLDSDENLIVRSEREYLAYLVDHPEGLTSQNSQQTSEALALISAANYGTAPLSGEAVTQLYGKKLRLSSTKIDRLASCRFAYFLEYGLGAKEREQAEANPLVYGSFVHDVLEHTAKQVMAEGGFHAVPLERVLELAEARMEYYAQEVLKDLWDCARTEYLFRRNFAEIRTVVEDLYRELSMSEFDPRWFELRFAEKGAMPAVKIVGEKMVAELVGSVDRADIWHDGERFFVRVIDYKTGSKSFDYGKVLNGLNLQMLLYLFALEKSGQRLLNSPLAPAGVLYFSTKVSDITLSDKFDEKTMEKKQREGRKRSGLVLDSTPVLQAMEGFEKEPEYLPVSLDKAGALTGGLFRFEQLRDLERFIFRTVAALGDSLCAGEIRPNPYFFDMQDSACQFCSFKTVCRDRVDKRWLKHVQAEEFWSKVGEKS